MSGEGKTEFSDSRTTDSGFLSGGSLAYSGEITSEEFKTQSSPLETDDHRPIEKEINVQQQQQQPQQKQQEEENNLMRLDSGVDVGLTDSFSVLSLEKNSELNDLNVDSRKCLKSSNNLSNVRIDDDFDNEKENRQDENDIIYKKNNKEQISWELYFEQDEDGDTHLHAAIVQGFVEVALALIRAAPHPRLLDTPNDDALTPLHLAVATGQWRVVRWLVVAGARPGPRNLRGDSPLHLCAQTGDLQCCKAIIDPVAQIERDDLALSYPPQPYQQVDFQQWNYEGQTCVHVAAINGHVDVLRHLVWYGADINAREGRSGYTALHYAIENHDERLALFLLQCTKLDATQVTYGGRSVLQLGFPVPSAILEALRSRGVPSSYSSDEEYDSDSDDDDNEYPFESTTTTSFVPKPIIQAISV